VHRLKFTCTHKLRVTLFPRPTAILGYVHVAVKVVVTVTVTVMMR
jgi:hypothetical protein